MRVRKRSGAEELIASYPQYVVDEPQKWKGRWTERFGNDQPIHIEIGMGKGQFIFGMAKAHPEINYIGIDMQTSVVSFALDKLIAEEVPNLQLLHVDGSELTKRSMNKFHVPPANCILKRIIKGSLNIR